MKRLITLFSLVICIQYASAQVKLGLKFSPQLTWVSPESKSISTSGTRLNVSYGLMADFGFTENYAFATEIAITTMSGRLNPGTVQITRDGNTQTVNNLEYLYKLQYLQIPLLLRMRTNELGYWRFYAEFGWNMNFLIRSKADIKATGLDLENVNVNDPDPEDAFDVRTNETPSKGLSSKVNFFRNSLVIGAGTQYRAFGNTLLVTGLRYENTLSDFTDEDRWKASMNLLSLHVGVLF